MSGLIPSPQSKQTNFLSLDKARGWFIVTFVSEFQASDSDHFRPFLAAFEGKRLIFGLFCKNAIIRSKWNLTLFSILNICPFLMDLLSWLF